MMALLTAVLFAALCFGALAWLSGAQGPDGASWPGFLNNIGDFLTARPGDGLGYTGVLPALVGTGVLVLLMTAVVAPFGVAAAIYLGEYARRSWYTDLVRIAVQNLAGVPAIIYGVFGLGFFVYGVGGSLDQLWFDDALPQPTLGTPGLLWAALTLALLNLPVVIVASLEGLGRIPNSLREGSLALGANQSETILRVVLPAAAPSMLTGLVLAVARSAGEVAPLMLVGAVKYAPTLPVSTMAPFIHFEQKFMHLGFHVFDATLYASIPEGRIGLVSATALLLVAVIVALNGVAIALRHSLVRRFTERRGW
jgi:phosphate transport system permease protein